MNFKEDINDITYTPHLPSKRCRLISKFIGFLLSYTIYFITLLVWLKSDYFLAIASLLLLYVVGGIIKSYIRNSVIPPKLQEKNYTDQEIATWFTFERVC